MKSRTPLLAAALLYFFIAFPGEAGAQNNHWYALGGNCELGGAPYALAIKALPSIKRLYLGGGMGLRSDPTAKCVLGWNGTAFEVMGHGLTGTVYSMAIFEGDLYVGGSFTAFGGVANANNIASWDGVQWNAVGGGLNSWVKAMLVYDSKLYVGGNFTASGSTALKKIARWDGYSWSALGQGVGDTAEVRALAVMGGQLYVGGSFLNGAGIPEADRIMRWAGGQWSAIDSRLEQSESVDALAAGPGGLYVGGKFSRAGGVNGADNIALYSGSWQALNSGLPSYVKSLAAGVDGVYAGGAFSNADGDSNCGHIARWAGGAWHCLGTGLNATVFSILVDEHDVYAAGSLTMAGGNQCADYAARYNDADPPPTPPTYATASPAPNDSDAFEVNVSELKARAGKTVNVKFFIEELDPTLAGKVKVLIRVMRNNKAVRKLITTLVVKQLGKKHSEKLKTAGLKPGVYNVCVKATASFAMGKESVEECAELTLRK